MIKNRAAAQPCFLMGVSKKRIMIIGCCRSGKSTLARQLGDLLDIPVVHLDKIWWKPGWQHISREEFSDILQHELQKPCFIMDGNFNHTLQARIARCDTIIYLDFSRISCLLGVFKRILTTYGTVRPDMGDGCPERLDFDFIKWVWNFNKNNRQINYDLLCNAQHAKVYILKNRREVRSFLQTVEKSLLVNYI